MAESAFKINRVLTLNPQGSVPSSPINGDMYYDSSLKTYVMYQDGNWINVASRVDVASAANITSSTLTATVVQNSLIKITGSTLCDLHGLTASADAKEIRIYNNSTQFVTLKHESATELTASHRIKCLNNTDIPLDSRETALLAYDSSDSRWAVLSIYKEPVSSTGVVYDAVVGTAAQVLAGDATHSSITAAIAAVSANAFILVLNNTYTENVIVDKALRIMGKGNGAVINGTLTLNSSASQCYVSSLRVTGNITLSSGANNNFIRECWQATGQTISDSGANNAVLIIQE